MKLVLLSLFSFTFNTSAAPPVLDKMVQDIRKAGKGMVIMDLDETVLDTHSRKYNAYLESLKIHCGNAEDTLNTPKSRDCERFWGLSKSDFYKVDNGHSSYELLNRLGVGWSELVVKLNQSMIEFYMSKRWLDQDSSMPGANTFVRRLKRAGATVYFVSPRFDETQKEGTLARMKELGLLQTGQEDKLILRQMGQSPSDFKASVIQKLKKESKRSALPVIGLFENEPENLNAWKRAFPEALAVLIKGNILLNVHLTPEAHVLKDYR